MKPENIDLLTSLSAPAVHPDGTRAVVAAKRPNFDNDSYTGQLWDVALDGSGARRITQGTADGAPQFSPDGSILAFVRRDADGKPQIAIAPGTGGEARIITTAPLGISSFAFSRDGRFIAFEAARPEEDRYGTTEGVSGAQENPRHITTLKYRMNGAGFIVDKRSGIYVMEVPAVDDEPYVKPTGRAAKLAKDQRKDQGNAADEAADAASKDEYHLGVLGGEKGMPKATLVTRIDADASAPEFSPDGQWLYFTAELHEGSEADLRTDVYRVNVSGVLGGSETADATFTHPELVTAGSGDVAIDAVRFGVDGVLYGLGGDLGATGVEFVGKPAGVYSLGDGTPGAELKLLTDLGEDDATETPKLERGVTAGVWALSRHRGSSSPLHVTAEGVQRLDVGQRVVKAAVETPAGVVVTYSDPETPSDLALVKDGAFTRITDFGAKLRQQSTVIAPQEFTAIAADGHEVHGWIFVPEGEGPHPVLLNIHGGPFSAHDWAYFDEPQVYANAGYAVLHCNPRGSAGYGIEHGQAIKGAMGTVDASDVLAFLEQAVASNASLDGERLGVMGGSYGGYLSAWLIGHDHRFKAAIVERGCLEPYAFQGSSDIGWFFLGEYMGRDAELQRQQSPFAAADENQTPTLIIHSEEDYRCPLEQAQQYFAKLKLQGTEAELLVFPGENHELSRAGTPWHRKQRFEAILEWWNRHLPVA
ncbi:S9 family peptidase [Neomicrococcus lactis]|uniref:S9 family peptidase n=1 Tax=Neomicrococcus lactis TaxID=732241 RepID=UPI002300DAB4|nr:S9 family peptidase [Neomicrococcus lactis]